MIRRPLFAVLLGLCAAVPLGLFALRPSHEARASAPAATADDWSAAAPGVVEPAGGFLRLGFPDNGRIAEVRVRAGDAVRAGDVLARLADDEQKARVAAAEAELAFRIADRDGASDGAGRNDPDRLRAEVAAAEQGLAEAQADLDAARAGKTRQDVAASQAAVEKADATLQDRQEAFRGASAMAALRGPATRKTAAVDAARADLAVARAEAGKTVLRAPVDGIVLEVRGRAGELILASSDEPIVTMGGAGRPAVRAELDETDAGKVAVGDDATVRGDGIADGAVRGRVVAVAPMVTRRRIGASSDGRAPLSNAQEVRVEIETPSAPLPGARVDVFFRHSDGQAREAVR